MASSFQSDDEVISGINVTPLVDVVLVLLVVFMITAPVIYQSAIKVKLPQARTGEEVQKSPLSFTITPAGDLILGQEKIEWDSLGQRLAAFGPKAAEETAVISADQTTPYGTVIKLMDILRQAGVTHFAQNVESIKSK
jgi:biopolymer transport protein ExbD